MNKPRKRPITFDTVGIAQGILAIEVLTDDADDWTVTHAAEFGNLTKNPVNGREWFLFVHKGYNEDDVLNYLRDLWDSRWPEEM